MGEDVPPGTYAHDCFQGRAVPDALKSVRGHLWLAPSNGNSGYLLEHSIAIPSYNSVLTLLRIDEAAEDLNEDEITLADLSPEDFKLSRRRWPRK
jgi:hypothetical protein